MGECIIGNFKIHIEVPAILSFFAFMLSGSLRTNLTIYRTCYVSLGYNETECALLGSKNPDNETANLEKIVEPYAALIGMVSSITESMITAILCIFIGPWSDKFGRKPFLLLPMVGYTFSYLLVVAYSLIPQLSPWYLMFSSVPVILSGGFSPFLTVLLCYISDVTSESNIGMRMGVFEGALTLGVMLGNLCSSYAFNYLGYAPVFAISGLCCFTAAIFIFFFIPESVTNVEVEDRWKGLFHMSNVTEMVKTTFKNRVNFDRTLILSSVLILTMFIIVVNGEMSVTFLFLREKLQWSLEKFTLYSAARDVGWIFGTILGIYILNKIFNMSEMILVFVGLISLVSSALVQGFATNDTFIYTSAGVHCFGAVLSPMMRAFLTKIVPSEEIGKVYALITSSESIFGMIGSPLYTMVYNATIKTNAGIFNFVTAGFYTLQMVAAVLIIFLKQFRTTESELLLPITSDEDDSDENVDANTTPVTT